MVHLPPFIAARRPFAQIPHNQEISVKAHAVDDAQLMRQSLAQRLISTRPVLSPYRCASPFSHRWRR